MLASGVGGVPGVLVWLLARSFGVPAGSPGVCIGLVALALACVAVCGVLWLVCALVLGLVLALAALVGRWRSAACVWGLALGSGACARSGVCRFRGCDPVWGRVAGGWWFLLVVSWCVRW